MTEPRPAGRLRPTTLEGRYVRLEPLRKAHARALGEQALDPSIWKHTSRMITTLAQLESYLGWLVAETEAGRMVSFATIARRGDGDPDRAVGSTSFGALAPEHLRAEIGWTFVSPPWQRTGVNREAKYLMLEHAFEDIGLRRVELKTDARNRRSRTAILAIGAKEEGTLRKHMVSQGGRVRNTVYFSITDDEWPQVKKRLAERLYGESR